MGNLEASGSPETYFDIINIDFVIDLHGLTRVYYWQINNLPTLEVSFTT